MFKIKQMHSFETKLRFLNGLMTAYKVRLRGLLITSNATLLGMTHDRGSSYYGTIIEINNRF